jgi:hypothetical protein
MINTLLRKLLPDLKVSVATIRDAKLVALEFPHRNVRAVILSSHIADKYRKHPDHNNLWVIGRGRK